MTEIGSHVGEQDLGNLDTSSFVDLLDTFVAIDPMKLVDADPEILLSGRRGRFTARTSHGKLNLQPTGDSTSAFQELSPELVPEWLNQAEGTLLAAGTEEVQDEIITPDSTSSRQGLVTALMIVSLIAVGASAYFTYQPATIINEKDYTLITDPGQTAELQLNAVGRYANVDGSIEILVEDSNRVVLIETAGPNDEEREESPDQYSPMTNASGQQVLLSHEIGVITISDRDTLSYNGDVYRRIN